MAERIAVEVKRILTTEDLSPFLNMENPEKEIMVDVRMTDNTIRGKAFEYATLVEL